MDFLGYFALTVMIVLILLLVALWCGDAVGSIQHTLGAGSGEE